MKTESSELINEIHSLAKNMNVKILNVCGGHERTVSKAGLRHTLPETIELIPGPGCPVCVCPEEDIYEVIQISLTQPVIVATFGDMLRVPINTSKSDASSLEKARAYGADIRAIATPQEVIRICQQEPNKHVIFFVAGFETTIAPIAGMIQQGVPENLLFYVSSRLTWPIVSVLLEDSNPGFNALIAPGHVASVMGAEQWRFVSDQYHIPTAVAGFTGRGLLTAIRAILLQINRNQAQLKNCYAQVVTPQGNGFARQSIEKTFDIVDANWRGIGAITQSGFTLNHRHAALDAQKLFPTLPQNRKNAGQMPAGCDCSQVILGKKTPTECRLYQRACTPRNPIGPCMVSDEGACRIWWSNGKRLEHSKSA